MMLSLVEDEAIFTLTQWPLIALLQLATLYWQTQGHY